MKLYKDRTEDEMVMPTSIYRLDKSKMYYLASPYSHEFKSFMIARYERTIKAGYKLIKEGFKLIEPIAMCHEKTMRFDLPGGYEYWKDRDRHLVDLCDGLIVLTLPGWDESIGVSDEIAWAEKQGKPICFVSPQQLNI